MAAPIPIEGPVLGRLTAKIAIIEFSDFECEYCQVFARDTLPALRAEFLDSGKALLNYRHLPRSRARPSARLAATIGECASRLGHFWSFHDDLFAFGLAPGTDAITRSLQRVGLTQLVLESCTEQEGQAALARDLALATRFSVQGTPVFLIGPVTQDGMMPAFRVNGAERLDTFRAAVAKVRAAPANR